MILVTMELVIFDTLSYLLQGISVDTIAICLGIKKKKKRIEIKYFQPLQNKTKGQDAAVRQQATPHWCQGATRKGSLVPMQGQGAHQVLMVCSASH